MTVCSDLTAGIYAENVNHKKKNVYLYEVHERPETTAYDSFMVPNTKNCALLWNIKYNLEIFSLYKFYRKCFYSLNSVLKSINTILDIYNIKYFF